MKSALVFLGSAARVDKGAESREHPEMQAGIKMLMALLGSMGTALGALYTLLQRFPSPDEDFRFALKSPPESQSYCLFISMTPEYAFCCAACTCRSQALGHRNLDQAWSSN